MPAIPKESVAVADTVNVPETVAPLTGAVREMEGADTLLTVTEMPLLAVALPAVSVRTAERRCDPLEAAVVFHEVLKEGPAPATELPKLEPSSLNWMLATPKEAEAFAETVTVPESVAPLTGAVREIEGGVGPPLKPLLGAYSLTMKFAAVNPVVPVEIVMF
jgi:hypothetical protein